MRPILHGDLVAVARVLLALPFEYRKTCAEVIFDQAHAADKYAKRTGRPHPIWGNGSLLAAVSRHPSSPEPFLSDKHYLSALILVLEQALARKSRDCVSKS